MEVKIKERLEKVKKLFDEIDHSTGGKDKYCPLIFSFLFVIYPKEIHINELYRKLREHTKFKTLSKDTLYKHIKHLENHNFIVDRIDNNKRYIKISPYFIEFAEGIMIQDWDLFEKKLLSEMREEYYEPLTIELIDIFFKDMFNIIKNSIELPEKIYEYNIFYFSARHEAFLKTFRMRVKEKEEEKVIKTLEKINNTWNEYKNIYWNDVIKRLSFYNEKNKK